MNAQQPADPPRLRITFLLSSLRLSGGVMLVLDLANGLAARGHRVTLVVPGKCTDSAMAAMIDPSVSVHESRVPLHGRGGRLHMARLAIAMAGLVPHSDLVIATHTPTTVPALIAGRLFKRGRLVWLFQDYTEMFRGRPAEAWLMRRALNWQVAALTVSKSTTDELRTLGSAPIINIGNALSSEAYLSPVYFEDRPRNDPPVVLFVGNDRPRKGLNDLLVAATLLEEQGRPVRLEIVSRDSFTVDSHLPYRLRVAISTAEVVKLMQTCDLYVLASWGEGLGWPPLEAMACGAPVVLTDCGGPGEYARDGENALIVPPRAPQLMAAAILRLLRDRELASLLSHAGPETAAPYRKKPLVDRTEAALWEIMRPFESSSA